MTQTLTPKQELFVQEYMIDLNGKQAAIRAKYSPATAENQASKLLSLSKVKKAVREAQAERAERTGVDSDWIVARLKELYKASLVKDDLKNARGCLELLGKTCGPYLDRLSTEPAKINVTILKVVRSNDAAA